MNTIERAQGRWAEILPRLGIDRRFLSKINGPCPLCGGKDRFSWDNKNGSGSYICRQCGAGYPIQLLGKKFGWSSKTALDEIDKVIGKGATCVKQRDTRRSDELRTRDIRSLLNDADAPEIVVAYLRRRGLSVSSPVLRGHRACPYFSNASYTPAGRYPAVLAPVLGPDGQIKTAHRIYDAPQLEKGERKKNMPVVGTINGGAVRLFDFDDELAIGEGIETMLAVHQMHGLPVWACLTAHGIESFALPTGVSRLHIYADNDENYTGQKAACALANRLSIRNKIRVAVHFPPITGTDWLDVLNLGEIR